ncbi:hypothetical protein BHM03_00042944, partial [Ensete ventricosum]
GQNGASRRVTNQDLELCSLNLDDKADLKRQVSRNPECPAIGEECISFRMVFMQENLVLALFVLYIVSPSSPNCNAL